MQEKKFLKKKKNNFYSFKCQGNISTLGPYMSITSKILQNKREREREENLYRSDL